MVEIVLRDMQPVSSKTGKKVGTFRRKTRGKAYDSPRVNLSSRLNAFIGMMYKEYQGRGVLSVGGEALEGDVIVLFFPDSWQPENEAEIEAAAGSEYEDYQRWLDEERARREEEEEMAWREGRPEEGPP